MSNLAPQTAHLTATQWQPGQSGNPLGKPKGTKHLSTYIQDLMTSDEFTITLRKQKTKQVEFEGIPIRAIIYVAIQKALDGDMAAMNWLAKYGWGKPQEEELEEKGVVVFINKVPRPEIRTVKNVSKG